MFVKAKNYESAIQKVRIELGTLLGLETDEEAFITLKEMSTFHTINLRESVKNNREDIIKYFHDILPEIIVDHNFYETEQKKMTNEELRDFLFEKITVATKVLNDYSKSAFFTQGNKNASK